MSRGSAASPGTLREGSLSSARRRRSVVTVTKDGVPYLQGPGGSVDSGSAGYVINIQPTYDCLYDSANEAWSLPPGKYHFQVSLDGQVLSQGDLTVN